MSAITPAVRVSRLAKRFGECAVIGRLDLDVAFGEALALIGANGAGKSTVLRMLVRLAEADSGDIQVLGEDVRTMKASALKRFRSRVGFVFQRHNLVARANALTNVIHGVQSRERGPRTWCHALARAEVRAEAMACLEAVGLADKALQRTDSLSGGQSQRVAIARMLMQRPELVLADEPDASLDPRAGRGVMELLYRLTREKSITLVFVSHHMAHAVAFADRVVGLAGGQVALDRPAARCDERQLAAFFDVAEFPAPEEQPAAPGRIYA